MKREDRVEANRKEPEMSFYDVRINCPPCRRILAGMLEICEDFGKEDVSIEKVVRESSDRLKYFGILRAYLVEDHIEKRLDEYYGEEYPKKGITRTELRSKAGMKNKTFAEHLRDHLLHYDILGQKKDKSYGLGKNFPYGNTPWVVEFIKSIPPSRVVWRGGVGYFNVSSIMDDKKLVRISKQLEKVFGEIFRDDAGHLVLPNVIVLDMREVLRTCMSGGQVCFGAPPTISILSRTSV